MRVAALSDYLVTLNGRTAPIFKEVYGVPEEKIVMTHYGAPDTPFVDPNFYSVWATWSSRAGSFMSRRAAVLYCAADISIALATGNVNGLLDWLKARA
jgi:hypothetical protein